MLKASISIDSRAILKMNVVLLAHRSRTVGAQDILRGLSSLNCLVHLIDRWRLSDRILQCAAHWESRHLACSPDDEPLDTTSEGCRALEQEICRRRRIIQDDGVGVRFERINIQFVRARL